MSREGAFRETDMAQALINSKRPKFSMKKRLLAVGCTALPLITLIWAEKAGAQGQTSTPPTSSAVASGPNAVTEKAFFTQYCVVCHNQKAKASSQPAALAITLDNLDVAHVEQSPESWERVVRKVRAGMMPPAGMPRQKPEVFEANIQWLENELDKHETNTLPPPGLHRLNRTEYKNAVRDVLALDIDP